LAEGDLPVHARLNKNQQVPESEDRQLAEALAKSAKEGAATSTSGRVLLQNFNIFKGMRGAFF
jgi:hypothetical protein